MLLYLPLQIPLVAGVLLLLLADYLSLWTPVRRFGLATLMIVLITGIEVALSQAADLGQLSLSAAVAIFGIPTTLVLGGCYLALYLLRRLNAPPNARAIDAGLLSILATAIAPYFVFAMGCAATHSCP